MSQPIRSREKLYELIETLREIDERRYGPEWGIESVGDVADGMRNLMHLLEGGLFSHFDADPERPVFRRIVSPTRKFRGDNSDAIYFDAAIRSDREYRVQGNMAGGRLRLDHDRGGTRRRRPTPRGPPRESRTRSSTSTPKEISNSCFPQRSRRAGGTG